MIMINKYIKKSIPVEAIQFQYTAEGLKELKEFCGNALLDVWKEKHPAAMAKAQIATLEDGEKEYKVQHIANEGDYIIKGVEGEFYPCKQSIFEKTYIKVDSS